MATHPPPRRSSKDLYRYLAGPPVLRCWFCQAENPRGTSILTSHVPGRDTKIPCCATGEGCRDGRIFHGPRAKPHQPGEGCSICGPAQARGNINRGHQYGANRGAGNNRDR